MKRIFILSSHPLFSAGVETLLHDEVDLEFVGRETDPDRAIERIKELKPDMVILDSEYATCNSDPVLMRIFQEQLGIRVIGMNLQNNRMYIYHEEQRMLEQVDDLRQAIQGNPSKSKLTSALDLDRKGGLDSHSIST